jgi:hypothetical protein
MKNLSYTIHHVQTIEVIYEGMKSIFKTDYHIDLIVALHIKSRCFEVITYDPESGYAAPRIYLNADLVYKQLNQKDIVQESDSLIKKYMRARKPFTLSDIQKSVENTFIVNFLLSRMYLRKPNSQQTSKNQSEQVFIVDFDTSDCIVPNNSTRSGKLIYPGPNAPMGVKPLRITFCKNCE